MNNNPNLNIEEGTITFWVQPNKISYDDNSVFPLAQFDPPNGSILILKDSDKKIKFFHVYLGKGRTDIETDVSKLERIKKHFFVFTWSVNNKELKIYIDGKQKTVQEIKY